MTKIIAREEYCIGCHLCEVYCAAAHSSYPHNLIKAFQGPDPVPGPRITVEENQPLSFALQCRHCEDPYCLKACITGAMFRDPESNLVLNDPDRCVGCWTCILVCPYGAIFRDTSEGKIVAKCDLCIAQGEPACVKNCPNNALVLQEGGE